MRRPADLPNPPQSVASRQNNNNTSSSSSTAAGAGSPSTSSGRLVSAQSALKLPTAPTSIITGKPLLSIKGTRVIFRQMQQQHTSAADPNSNNKQSQQQQQKEVLSEGIIVEHDESTKTIVIESGTQVISGVSTEHSGDSVTVWTGPSEIVDTDDLVAIRQPDTLSVLYCLQQRFFMKLPYTWLTRDSLVYVNPFQKCPDIFAGGQPHPFSVAEQARKIILNDESDTVAAVITGQSGSGKTEAAKMILRQFASTLQQSLLSSPSSPSSSNNNNSESFVSLISAVNPILESFGNAVTSANSNSSRFIRTTRITTDRNCRPLGAEIQGSLLETSRLCGLRPGESNFHIFYALLAGLPSKEKLDLELTDPSLFKSLIASGAFSSSSNSNNNTSSSSSNWLAAAPPHNLHTILEAMKQIGMTSNDTQLVFRALAFVLHILNLEFAGDLQAKVSPGTQKSLQIAAKILKIDPTKLEESMTQAKFTDPSTKQQISRRFTVSGATASRDTLARNLYQSLFLWIVSKVNESLKKKCEAMLQKLSTTAEDQDSSSKSKNKNSSNNTTNNNKNKKDFQQQQEDDLLDRKQYSLLILDIFGFESMRNIPNGDGVAPPSVSELNCHNGLEQLLINVVNEELQNLFTETSLIGFCDELSREGIQIPTNEMAQAENMARELSGSQRKTLDALEKKSGGILATINDDSKLGTPSTAAVLQDRVLALIPKHAGVIKRPKGVPDPEHPSFIVEHFACPVPYSATSMSIKNKVSAAGLATLIPLITSDASMLELLRSAEGASRKGSGSTTFTALLKEQFSTVIETLRSARCLWVRCIKPNNMSTPNMFDVKDVKRQLLTAGVLASVSVLAQGLSVRLPIKDFALRFATCLDKYPFKDVEALNYKKICEAIAKKIMLITQNQKFGTKTTGALALQKQREQIQFQSEQARVMQIGLTKVFCNADSYELLVQTSNSRILQYVLQLQRVGRGMMQETGGRKFTGDLLRSAIRRKVAHELALRMEQERPIRNALEIERCAEEEKSVLRMQSMKPVTNQFKQEAKEMGDTVKNFLNTMHNELQRVCVDVGLYDRVRKQKERELEEQHKLEEEIARKREVKEEREIRGAALAIFKKTPTHQRLATKQEEEEKKKREEHRAKLKYQIDRAHADVSRQRSMAEQQLQRSSARHHASQQVGWLHEHLRRSWQRLDHQAEIAGTRQQMQQAAPGYLQDYHERQAERAVSARRTESIRAPSSSASSSSHSLISPSYYQDE